MADYTNSRGLGGRTRRYQGPSDMPAVGYQPRDRRFQDPGAAPTVKPPRAPSAMPEPAVSASPSVPPPVVKPVAPPVLTQTPKNTRPTMRGNVVPPPVPQDQIDAYLARPPRAGNPEDDEFRRLPQGNPRAEQLRQQYEQMMAQATSLPVMGQPPTGQPLNAAPAPVATIPQNYLDAATQAAQASQAQLDAEDLQLRQRYRPSAGRGRI